MQKLKKKSYLKKPTNQTKNVQSDKPWVIADILGRRSRLDLYVGRWNSLRRLLKWGKKRSWLPTKESGKYSCSIMKNSNNF